MNTKPLRSPRNCGRTGTGRCATSLELRDIAVELRLRRARGHGRPALDGLSLQVESGEVVAVAGVPGFGGTTLARVVAGILAPESGTIHVYGVDVTNVPASRRPVGFVPMGGGLLPNLTSAENVTYGLRLRKETSFVARQRLTAVAERLELQPSLALRPHELSPGQRIRTALARVAVRQVRVLAVDATAGAEGVAQLGRLIERAWPEAEISVLLCTHEPAVVDQAHRVVVVEDGRAGPSGTPAELRSAPPNLTTARLTHPQPMAELAGVVRDGVVDCNGLRVPAPPGVGDDRFVLVVIPAAALRIGPVGEGPAATIVPADPADPADATTRVLVEPADWPDAQWAAQSAVGERPRPGDRVGLEIASERVLVFDLQAKGIPRISPPLPAPVSP